MERQAIGLIHTDSAGGGARGVFFHGAIRAKVHAAGQRAFLLKLRYFYCVTISSYLKLTSDKLLATVFVSRRVWPFKIFV